MKFSIITPTYKRVDKLTRAIASVQAQSYEEWEMIIVNDSPDDESYHDLEHSLTDPRIHYHVNQKNSGVNFTRNFALDHISTDSDWVIFLDDDDYLSPDALQTFHSLILAHGDIHWFLTNRADKEGVSVTKIKTPNTTYSYILNYLLLRRARGDATHAISTEHLHNIRFSRKIKQGEEWLFFYQLGLNERMFYHNHNSTITDGYDTKDGLNFRKRTRGDQLETLTSLFSEGVSLGISYRPSFMLYMLIRLIRALIR